jgi:hypothetical protein
VSQRLDALDERDELEKLRRLYAFFARVEARAATCMQRAYRQRLAEVGAALPVQAAIRGRLARRRASALAAGEAERRAELEAAEAAAAARRKREWEMRFSTLVLRSEARAAMRIQLAFWQRHIWRAEAAEAAAKAAAKAEAAAEEKKRARAEEFRRQHEERLAREAEKREEAEKRQAKAAAQADYRKRTLRSLPVRKRGRHWPHSWEPRELWVDVAAGKLVWQQPGARDDDDARSPRAGTRPQWARHRVVSKAARV